MQLAFSSYEFPPLDLFSTTLKKNPCNLLSSYFILFLFYFFYSDRFRTVVNVYGDCIGVGIVAHLSRKQLEDSSSRGQSSSTPAREDERGQDSSYSLSQDSKSPSPKITCNDESKL